MASERENFIYTAKLAEQAERYDGIAKSCKVKTEAINERNRSITFKVLEGDIMQLYKSVKVTIQISQGFANWTFEYEKAFEGAPGMDDYANVANMVSKSLDAYLLTH